MSKTLAAASNRTVGSAVLSGSSIPRAVMVANCGATEDGCGTRASPRSASRKFRTWTSRDSIGSVSAGHFSVASSSQVATSRRSRVSSAPSTKWSRMVSGMPRSTASASKRTGPAFSTASGSSTESSLPRMASRKTSGLGEPGRGTMSMATSVVAPAPLDAVLTDGHRELGGEVSQPDVGAGGARLAALGVGGIRFPQLGAGIDVDPVARLVLDAERVGEVALGAAEDVDVDRAGQRRDGGGRVDGVAGLGQAVDLDVGFEGHRPVADPGPRCRSRRARVSNCRPRTFSTRPVISCSSPSVCRFRYCCWVGTNGTNSVGTSTFE